MADIKVSALTEVTEAADDDVLYIVDATTSKKITALNLVNKTYQNDFNDNSTENIIVGLITSIRATKVEYTLETTTNYETGVIRIVHDGTNANLDVIKVGQATTIPGITYSADISGSNLRLNIAATAVGSNLKFKYKLSSIGLTS